MAIRPDYQTGTIDLVASSADFTTTGAALQMVAVQPGDAIITPSGHVLIIATITGQNSGTLFLPCPAAAAGAGLALRIRFQPDGSRYQGAVRNLIDLLSSGNLEAFAALVGAAGMVPIFIGPGTLDLADPATFGLQDPNGSLGKLAALTLAANKILNTDASSNLIQSDISSLGLALLSLAGTNGNIPVMTGAGTAASRPIVGSVSQAAGIPTGALFETGSNANGRYFRTADGFQLCMRRLTGVTIPGGSPGNVNISWTYPAAFVDLLYVDLRHVTADNVYVTSSNFSYADTAAFNAYVFNNFAASVTGTVFTLSMGRWF